MLEFLGEVHAERGSRSTKKLLKCIRRPMTHWPSIHCVIPVGVTSDNHFYSEGWTHDVWHVTETKGKVIPYSGHIHNISTRNVYHTHTNLSEMADNDNTIEGCVE